MQRITNGSYRAAYTHLANAPLGSQIAFRSNSVTRMTTTRSYDFLNRLTDIQNSTGVAPVSLSAYPYNAANQRTALTNADNAHWVYTLEGIHMPWLQPNINRLMLVLTVGTLSLCGCFLAVSDKEWERTVPGVYEGSLQNFREVLDLNQDGSFRHEFFTGQQLVHSGTGKWSYDVKSGMIRVAPFTSYYERETRSSTTNGVTKAADVFAVLRYGKSASRITQSTDVDYSLRKKGAE